MNSGAAIGDLARPSRTHDAGVTAATASRFADIGPRLLSAVVLGPLGVAAAWAGEPWLAGAAGAAVAAMSFEWARMSEPSRLYPAFLVTLAGALGAVMFASRDQMAVAAMWLLACGLVAALRRRGIAPRLESFLGALYIGAPCALFIWLREGNAAGLATVFFLFAAIWSADVFAYLGGVAIGGPRLHPALSPQKTWSGIFCGVAAGAVAGAVFAAVSARAPWALYAACGGVTALVGLGGDLLESHLKRRYGVKDASRLIPGHGGVLDRIDGLMAATIVWACAYALWPSLPGALFGAAA